MITAVVLIGSALWIVFAWSLYSLGKCTGWLECYHTAYLPQSKRMDEVFEIAHALSDLAERAIAEEA